jgi:hypothetical protein
MCMCSGSNCWRPFFQKWLETEGICSCISVLFICKNIIFHCVSWQLNNTSAELWQTSLENYMLVTVFQVWNTNLIMNERAVPMLGTIYKLLSCGKSQNILVIRPPSSFHYTSARKILAVLYHSVSPGQQQGIVGSWIPTKKVVNP